MCCVRRSDDFEFSSLSCFRHCGGGVMVAEWLAQSGQYSTFSAQRWLSVDMKWGKHRFSAELRVSTGTLSRSVRSGDVFKLLTNQESLVFNVRRCASAVLAVAVCLSVHPSVCPSVRPSQAGILSKRLDESSWFCHDGFLPSIPHCAIKKSAAAKITATFFWNLVPNSGLGQFCHKSVVLSTKLVDGRAYWPNLRRSTGCGCLLHVRRP